MMKSEIYMESMKNNIRCMLCPEVELTDELMEKLCAMIKLLATDYERQITQEIYDMWDEAAKKSESEDKTDDVF